MWELAIDCANIKRQGWNRTKSIQCHIYNDRCLINMFLSSLTRNRNYKYYWFINIRFILMLSLSISPAPHHESGKGIHTLAVGRLMILLSSHNIWEYSQVYLCSKENEYRFQQNKNYHVDAPTLQFFVSYLIGNKANKTVFCLKIYFITTSFEINSYFTIN